MGGPYAGALGDAPDLAQETLQSKYHRALGSRGAHGHLQALEEQGVGAGVATGTRNAQVLACSQAPLQLQEYISAECTLCTSKAPEHSTRHVHERKLLIQCAAY